MGEQEGCGREPAEEGVIYCERNGVLASVLEVIAVDHARESVKIMKGAAFPRQGGANALCEGVGDDQPPKQCFGSDHCAGCKKECDDNSGCGRESTEECFEYCEEKYGVCPYP